LSVALDDVEGICESIAVDSPRSAAAIGRRVFAVAPRLSAFPLSGRVVPEVESEDIREIIVASYRVMYRLLPDEVEVMRVIHGRRLFLKALLERPSGD
jgi:toxin ParE1/3/4